jgi:hypothetical protein
MGGKHSNNPCKNRCGDRFFLIRKDHDSTSSELRSSHRLLNIPLPQPTSGYTPCCRVARTAAPSSEFLVQHATDLLWCVHSVHEYSLSHVSQPYRYLVDAQVQPT